MKTLSVETLREMAVHLYGSNLAIAETEVPVFVERHEEFLPVIRPFRFTCLSNSIKENAVGEFLEFVRSNYRTKDGSA